MVKIKPPHAAIVDEILRQHLAPETKKFVFGSRATCKTCRPLSDLDIALDNGDRLDQNTLVDLCQAFEDSDLPYRVDIVDLHDVRPTFRAIIEKQKIPLDFSKVF